MNAENNHSRLLLVIVDGINELKGLDVKVLDLRCLENSVCNHFVICTGTSNIHAHAISTYIQKKARDDLKEKPWHVEGTKFSEWILLDYIDVVVHVFQKYAREFYDIESFWGDAKEIKIKRGEREQKLMNN